VRKLTVHKVGGLNENLRIDVMDDPGDGGACHEYRVSLVNPGDEATPLTVRQEISFQKGALDDKGLNGISNEALLAIVIDRMQGFQTSKFACRENALALTSMEQALMWLQKRTRDRIARGVEGTHTV